MFDFVAQPDDMFILMLILSGPMLVLVPPFPRNSVAASSSIADTPSVVFDGADMSMDGLLHGWMALAEFWSSLMIRSTSGRDLPY